MISSRKYMLSSPKVILLQSEQIEIDSNREYVLLKSVYWGVCTSDVKSYKNGSGKHFGHEVIMKVTETNSDYFIIGEYIVPLHTSPDSNSHRLSLAFEEYGVYYLEDFSNLVHIPICEHVSVKNFVFLDTVCCVYHAISKLENIVDENSNIAIFGSGFVSLLMQLFLKKINAKYVVFSRNNSATNELFDVCVDTTGDVDFINSHIPIVKISGMLMLFSSSLFELIEYSSIRNRDINVFFPKFFNNKDLNYVVAFLKENNLEQYFKSYNGLVMLEEVLNETDNRNIIRGIIEL